MAGIVKEAINDAVAENAERADDHAHEHPAPRGRYLFFVSLTALGVVFGDIGTSPLYAFREVFHGHYAITVSSGNVLGVLSLIFWTLILVVTIKYVVFVLQADNRGEGGILALTALATPIKLLSKTERLWLVILGVFGAALLYGDGIITPAISVLSAIEGLRIATPLFSPYVIPLTIAIIIGLFAIQSSGTARIGRLFGPVMLVWFAVLALLGVSNIVGNPAVLAALNPLYALDFFRTNGWLGFLVLGTVFLAATGAEALYADLGHFGRRPIRLAWFSVAFPALVLNYYGQGALLLRNPAAAENPFYFLAPTWALYPMVVLSTLATVIASQALISGAFSITMQAIQLGFLPRLQIRHTSSTEAGQIYIPAVNWAMMLACIAIVFGFRTSSNLAAAYGIAVTSTMAITTVIFYIVVLERWKWSHLSAAALSGLFLIVDVAFLGANLVKIPQGGWFPIVVAVVLFTVMTTWKRGRRLVFGRLYEEGKSLDHVLEACRTKAQLRVPGPAVYLSDDPVGAPAALLANLEHNHVVHEFNILLTINTRQRPRISDAERIEVEEVGQGFFRVTLSYGFMEEPNVPLSIAQLKISGLALDPQQLTYFVDRARAIATPFPGMALWREKLFALMLRNSASSTDYYCLPPAQVVEIGRRVEV